MRKKHPNLVYVPASKDKKGREKAAHWQTEITVFEKGGTHCTADSGLAAAIDTLPRIGQYISSKFESRRYLAR
jgi:hypothetical protein